MLLLSCAAAQTSSPVTVKDVTVARNGANLRVEITLSSAVKPSVETAIHPDRILVDLPDTTCGEKSQKVHVNTNGVLLIRTAQHSANPPVTRIVVDLDQEHPYTLKSEGNRIILTVAPAVNARTSKQHGAPAAATSGNLIGIFRRRQEAPAPITEDSSAPTATPPPPPSVAASVSQPSHNSTETAPPPAPPAVVVPQSQGATASPQGPAGRVSFAQTQIATVATPPENSAGISSGTASSSYDPSGVTTTANATTDRKTTDFKASAVGEESAPTPPSPVAAPAGGNAATVIARTDDPSLRTVFKVKYVAEGVAYLEGGRARGSPKV